MTRKEILMISLVLVAILTLGAVSAAEDVSMDNAQVLDDLNLDDNSDIPIEESSTDVEMDDGDIAIDDELDIIDDSKDNLGSSKLADDPQVVTNESFYTYFDSNGKIKSDVSGDLTLQGEFEDLVTFIDIDRSVTINSDNAVLKNMGIVIESSGVKLDGLTLISDTSLGPLIYVGGSDATLTNLNINYSVGDEDATAIYIGGVDNVELTDSTIFFESTVSSDDIGQDK